MKGTEKLTKANQSSEKLLTLMQILSEQSQPIRLQDLSRLADMNVSTTLRFLATLQSCGYAAQELGTGHYFLTLKICTIANNVLAHTDLCRVCDPYLRELADEFGESANLSIEQDMRMVYIIVVNSRTQTLTTRQRIGNVAPMHCTGVGKLMLLNYTEEMIDQLITKRGLQKFTDHTVVQKQQLMMLLEEVRRRGYACDNEECELGLRCIAVPIYDHTQRIVAGISVTGPTIRMTDETIAAKLPMMQIAADAISFRLGYTPSA